MDDVRGLFLGMPHGTTPAAVTTNKNIIILVPLRAVETFKRKRVGQTAVSDNQSSSVTLNELEKKARKIYCNFEFQRRSHTMTKSMFLILKNNFNMQSMKKTTNLMHRRPITCPHPGSKENLFS